MEILIQVLAVIVAILLIGVVLIQKSKGGGLSSSFAGSNQIMGVRRTNDFIEKATWILASILCVLAIASAFVGGNNDNTSGSKVLQEVSNNQAPAEAQGQYGSESAQDSTAQPAQPAQGDSVAPTTQPVQENAPVQETATAQPTQGDSASQAATPSN